MSQTSATPTPTPSATRIDIDALALEGVNCDEAAATAKAAGVQSVTCEPGEAAPAGDQVGNVYRVSPTGSIEPTTLLTLTFYADQTPLSAPAAATLPATVEPGSTVQVTWSGYSCPSGAGSPVFYNFTATRGQFSNGQSTSSFPAGSGRADLLVTGNDGETLTVSYTVTCGSDSGEDRISPASPEANTPIAAPAEEEEPQNQATPPANQ